MSRKKLSEKPVKITLNVFASDYQRMKELYPSVGAAVAIRQLIRQHVQSQDRKLATATAANLALELDLEITDVG